MLAKITLILTLLVSLLFVTQAQLAPLPVEMKQGGACAGMDCARGCCTNMACCTVTEQQKVPPKPALASQPTHLQLATLGLRVCIPLFIPPAPRRSFVILHEASTAHSLSPRAASCIWLI